MTTKINSYTIHIAGLGLVLLEHSARARRILITVKPDKGVRVAVPNRVSFEKALEFIKLKEDWIRKTLVRIRQTESRQQELAKMFSTIDKVEARKTLLAKLQVMAGKHGFTYRKVSLRNQKTRWGSCSQRGNISLNMKLVVLPEELVDYVILHELVHTRIHNHSRHFWVELNKYVKDADAVASRLRQYELRLM